VPLKPLGRLLSALVVIVALRLLASDTSLVERSREGGPLVFLSILLSRASGSVPLSLAEGVLVLAVVVPGFVLLRAQRASRRARSLAPLAAAALAIASWGAFAAVLFTLLFGLDYFRPRLADRLGWRSREELPDAVAAAGTVVDLANRSYLEAFTSSDLGEPSPALKGGAATDAALEESYARLSSSLPLGAAFGEARGPAKPLRVLSPILCRLGLTGFYFPWTGEANFNDLVLPWERVHTIAHEKAHQRGIAREDEANFVGALACLTSKDPWLRYAGAFFAENDLLNALARARAPEIGALLRRRAPGVVRDQEAERAFWERYRGAAEKVSRAVNDTYLKSQGVREGALSYEESARLLTLYFAFFCKDGSCLPGAPAETQRPIASRLRSTSSSVVAQDETLIRMAARPLNVVPLQKQVPSD
jgi:hypothetical protein